MVPGVTSLFSMIASPTVVFFFLLSIDFSYGAKILVYNPVMRQSHTNFMSTIAQILVEEGHNVVSSAVSSICRRFWRPSGTLTSASMRENSTGPSR